MKLLENALEIFQWWAKGMAILLAAALALSALIWCIENAKAFLFFVVTPLGVGYTFFSLPKPKKRRDIEASQIETNRMMGLSFQGQGMLDLAFEKFRACPLDETTADMLYNLALEYERKGQRDKAIEVRQHIAAGYAPKAKTR